MPDLDPIAVQMRQARQQLGWSLRDMEAETGIRDITIGSWERGDRHPPLHQVRRWLSSLGFDLAVVPDRWVGYRIWLDEVRGRHEAYEAAGKALAAAAATEGADVRSAVEAVAEAAQDCGADVRDLLWLLDQVVAPAGLVSADAAGSHRDGDLDHGGDR